MKDLDVAALHPREAYALLTSFIIPRAIAWVSTTDGAHTNLAPFSFFTGLGSDPPMITLGIADRRDGPKDTVRLARKTGVLCVNLVEEHDAERMNATSGEYGPEVSEAQLHGIALVPCAKIAAMRVASARAALECRLVDVHAYGRKHKVNLVVAEVVHAHVDDALVAANGVTLETDHARPVARLGGTRYATLGARFTMERPKVETT